MAQLSTVVYEVKWHMCLLSIFVSQFKGRSSLGTLFDRQCSCTCSMYTITGLKQLVVTDIASI